jgi:hypothetical protein
LANKRIHFMSCLRLSLFSLLIVTRDVCIFNACTVENVGGRSADDHDASGEKV